LSVHSRLTDLACHPVIAGMGGHKLLLLARYLFMTGSLLDGCIIGIIRCSQEIFDTRLLVQRQQQPTTGN
jgi:hypothetical protein